jgi:negative elongation factor B
MLYLLYLLTVPLPSFQNALGMLDLLGVPRSEVHVSLLNKLKEKMLSIINAQTLTKEMYGASRKTFSLDGDADFGRFLELLDSTFFWITFEELRVIPISIMKLNPTLIPSSYLKQIASTSSISSTSQSANTPSLIGTSPSLYADMPLEIKRQIWLFDEPLLQAQLAPLIDNYCIHYLTHTAAFQMLHASESTTFVTPQKR